MKPKGYRDQGGRRPGLRQGTWHSFGVQDGLVYDTVQQVLQDRKGDIWIATEGGITRYRPSTTDLVMAAGGGVGRERREDIPLLTS